MHPKRITHPLGYSREKSQELECGLHEKEKSSELIAKRRAETQDRFLAAARQIKGALGTGEVIDLLHLTRVQLGDPRRLIVVVHFDHLEVSKVGQFAIFHDFHDFVHL